MTGRIRGTLISIALYILKPIFTLTFPIHTPDCQRIGRRYPHRPGSLFPPYPALHEPVSHFFQMKTQGPDEDRAPAPPVTDPSIHPSPGHSFPSSREISSISDSGAISHSFTVFAKLYIIRRHIPMLIARMAQRNISWFFEKNGSDATK